MFRNPVWQTKFVQEYHVIGVLANRNEVKSIDRIFASSSNFQNTLQNLEKMKYQ